MHRKILCILTVLTIAVSISACGSGNTDSSTAPATSGSTAATAAATAEAAETAPGTTAAETSAVTGTSAAEITFTEPEKGYDLEYWTEGSLTAQSIREYVAEVSDEGSEGYVPPAERIAVFDLDGTLYGELFPTYFDQCLLMHRMLHDDAYPDKNKDPDDKAYLEALEKAMRAREPEPDYDKSSGQMLAEAFKGYTVDEYRAYIRDFMSEPVYGFEGMTYAEGFYKPMVSLIRYLSENDFQVFIVSGAERTLLRELTKGTLDKWVPPCNVIGTTFSLEAEKQGDTEGRKYTYAPDDRVLLEGNMIFKNLKMNKIVSLVDEIGDEPILSFGNSSGDISMAQYTVQNGGRAYMLLCDDTERDYGSPETNATSSASRPSR